MTMNSAGTTEEMRQILVQPSLPALKQPRMLSPEDLSESVPSARKLLSMGPGS